MFKWITAEGEELELKEPYKLRDIEGAGGAPTDIQMQKAPFQDGQTLIDQLLEYRAITLDIAIIGTSRQDIYTKRRELSRLFNPKLGTGFLRWEQEGETYEIEAVAEESPEFPGGDASSGGFQVALITLICPDPAWRDPEQSGEPLGLLGGGLMFPLLLNEDEEMDTVFANRSDEVVVTNEGDIRTPVNIIFYGPAENPIVTNETTGEFVQVDRVLLSDEKLIINTAFGDKSVTLVDGNGNESNAFGEIDLNSTFWQLQTGQNIISFDSDVDKEDAAVEIRYRNKYVGV